MKKEAALRNMKKTVECLYQNKEKEALDKVTEWLPFFEHMAEAQAEKKDGSVLQIIRFMKDLIENYNYKDMIGMADCLQEHAFDFIEKYGEE